MADPQALYTYLVRQKGLTPNAALGILANVQQESGFNPSALNEKEGAFGLFQWRQDRRTGLQGQYGETPNWQQQLDYALSEPEGAAFAKQDFASPEDATVSFMRNFERPADPEKEVAWRTAHLPDLQKQLGIGAVDTRMAQNRIGSTDTDHSPAGAPTMAKLTLPPQVPAMQGLQWAMPPQEGDNSPLPGSWQDLGSDPLLHIGLGLLTTKGGVGKGVAAGLKSFMAAEGSKGQRELQNLQIAKLKYDLLRGDAPTAQQQNINWLVQSGMPMEEAVGLVMKQGSTVVNVGGGQGQYGPVAAGYVRKQDEQGGVYDEPVKGSAPAVERNQAIGDLKLARDRVAQMRDTIAQYGPEALPLFSDQKVRGQYEQGYSAVVSDIAKLRGMGVLQPGELANIEGRLTDPSSALAYMKSPEQLIAQYDTLLGQYDAKLGVTQGAQGGGIATPSRATGQSQTTGWTPEKEAEYRQLEREMNGGR